MLIKRCYFEEVKENFRAEKKRRILEECLSATQESVSFKNIENSIAKFSGDDSYSVGKWILDFEEAMCAFQCTENFKIDV